MRKLNKKDFDKLFKLVFVLLDMHKRKTPEEYETDALRALQRRSRREAGQLYELGGDGRRRRGDPKRRDINKAESDYELALKYSYDTESEKRIKSKIFGLGLERNRALVSLKQWNRQLEGKVYASITIISFIVALISVSFSFTGNVILGLTEKNFRWIGLCLFACGLTFTFLYFRKKK